MSSWGGGRLRVRSSINYAEDGHEDRDAPRGEGAGGSDSFVEEFDLARRGVSGGSSSANACRQARQRPTQQAGKKLFERFQPKMKVRPFRQVGKKGSNRSVANTNRTAYTGGSTARLFARPPTTLGLATPMTACFGRRTTGTFKQGRDGTGDGDDSPGIHEILRILQRLEEDTNTSTKRRRRLGQIAVPPWKKDVRSPDAERSLEKATEDTETPETKPCIVSLGKVGGTSAGISGDALNVPPTAAAAAGWTTMKPSPTKKPTPTKKARRHATSTLLARRRIKTEEDSAEAQHQPQARLDTEAAAAASSAGEGAPCPPSVKIFDAVVVKQPYEGDNRLAWRGPGSPSANNETKPRRSPSGPPCAGRVVAHRRAGGAPKEESRNDDLRCVGRPSHRRAGGAPKAERTNDDDLRCARGAAHGRAGGAPKAESRRGDVLREAAGSVVRLVVKEPPVEADRSVAVDRCDGRCERCNGRCERHRPDAVVVGDPSAKNRGSKPPPPPLPPPPPGKVAFTTTASSTESTPTESSRAESSRTDSSRTESSRTESSRTESSRAESSRSKSLRTESSRTESSRTESSRAEWSWTESSWTEPSSWTGLASVELPLSHTNNSNNANNDNELEEGKILEGHQHHRLEGGIFEDHHYHHHRLPRSPIEDRHHHLPPRPPIKDRRRFLPRQPKSSLNTAGRV